MLSRTFAGRFVGRTRHGLTVVELMVAVAIASMILTGLFMVTNSTSRTFRVQNDYGQSMDRLNFAMETIKQDLRRSSYLTVPNSNLQIYPNFARICRAGGIQTAVPAGLQALRVANGGATFDAPTGNDVMEGRQPDSLLLLGAFRTTRRYPVNLLSDGANSARIFSLGQPIQQMQYEFGGSILAVTSGLGGMTFLRAGTGSSVVDTGGATDRVTVALTDTMVTDATADDICRFAGVARENLEVTPLHYVRYDLRNDADERTTVLVREELDHAGTVLASYVVARNVVDFQVWFDNSSSAVGTQPQINQDGVTNGSTMWDDDGTMPWTWLNGSATAQPERARFGYIQISTRLDTPIPSLAYEGTGVGLRNSVEIWEPEGTGAAASWNATGDFTRVMTIRAEVELDNFTLSDL